MSKKAKSRKIGVFEFMGELLNKVNNPKDLKELNIAELPELCTEIREFLVDKVSKTGGHLAPNLGVVELTVGLHYIFNSPDDKIIFDVGHQTYVHKILTGRKDQFDTLRQLDGLSGFPKPYESEHDVYNSGHSSTSISAAIGIATANKLSGNPSYTIAVIGDGALTGGLAFEGLNNSNSKDLNLIVVLNDNQMSISQSVGGLSSYLNKIRSTAAYANSKKDVKNVLPKVPLIGKPLFRLLNYIKNSIKHAIIPSSVLFEQFGFTYLGPIDGNDIDAVTDYLERAKYLNKPVLVHMVTKKGKGYSFAEQNPNKFHGISAFDKATGEVLKPSSGSYSKKFGQVLKEEAARNNKIVAITAAMTDGVGLSEFRKIFKDRFYDVGIAEEHAVTFASGLAVQGYIPVFACYSTFLQRAYDQIVHDVALQNLHVIFAIDRAGIVGNDGETHQGLLDESFLSSIPNMTIMAPKDAVELEQMIKYAIKHNGPIAIRYPRGGYEEDLKKQIEDRIKEENKKDDAIKESIIEQGKAEVLIEGKDLTIVAYGKMVSRAYEVAELFKKDKISAEVINARFLKPFDCATISNSINKTKTVISIEDAYTQGGLASNVESLICKMNEVKSCFFGYPDEFIKHGSVNEIEKAYGLDKESIYNKTSKIIKSKPKKKINTNGKNKNTSKKETNKKEDKKDLE